MEDLQQYQQAIKVSEAVREILKTNEVYLVGGSVRDIFTGSKIKDFDYCTPLDPDEIERLVKEAGRKAYTVGKKFGTIGFKVPIEEIIDKGDVQPNEWTTQDYSRQTFIYVEVTTYRTEQYTSGNRKPEVVFIKELDKDLSRRDFTINAMVLKEDGQTYDPFGGRLDILAKQIKTVGLPKDRIQEDPLRMLRAARFASQLGFKVDPNMIGKMRQLGHSITTVSKERWVAELDKLLMGKEPMKGIDVLMDSELMKYVLPEVYITLLDTNVYRGVSEAFKANPEMDLDSRWNVLLYFIGHPYTKKEKKNGDVSFPNSDIVRQELCKGIALRLKFSNIRTRELENGTVVFNTIAL